MVILTIQSLHGKLVEEEMSSGIYQIKVIKEMHSVGVYIHQVKNQMFATGL